MNDQPRTVLRNEFNLERLPQAFTPARNGLLYSRSGHTRG